MTYRSNQEFKDRRKKIISELTIFLDGEKHCVINDDNTANKQIKLISRIHPNKVLRVEKGGGK